MTESLLQQNSYAEQLAYLTEMLTSADDAGVTDLAVTNTSKKEMRLFAEENREKRRDKLIKQLDFLLDAFDNLDELLQRFSASGAQLAYASVSSDAEQFLAWLKNAPSVTVEQLDYITCEEARLQVESLARRRRVEHLRFQEMASVASLLASELATNEALTLHLNPLRVWSQFQSAALLDEDAVVPVDVLFYAAGRDVHTALLDDDGVSLVKELTALEPCTISTWAACSANADCEQLIDLCAELAEMGLLAFR